MGLKGSVITIYRKKWIINKLGWLSFYKILSIQFFFIFYKIMFYIHYLKILPVEG